MIRPDGAHHAGSWSRAEKIFLVQQGAVNLLVAIVMAVVSTVLVFRGHPAVPLWGMGNLAFDLVPATLLPSIGGTLAITKATAMAISRGRIAPASFMSLRMLPHNDILAGSIIGLGCLAVLGSGFIVAVAVCYAGQPVRYADIFIVKLIYAGVLVCANTPIIVARARTRSRAGADELPAV
jgi:hypothetical protein